MFLLFRVPGITVHQLAVKTSVWGAAQLLIDGQPAPRGPKHGQFVLRRDDGTEIVAELKGQGIFKPVPDVVVAGETIQLAIPLKWYEVVWTALPLIMMIPALGGMLGMLFGGVGYGINHQIFRSERGRTFKFIASGGVTLAAVIGWLVSAVLLNFVVNAVIPPKPKPFSSTPGQFRVETPIPFVESVEPAQTNIGTVNNYMFTGDSGVNAYIVSYADYPADFVQRTESGTLLDTAQDGVARSLKARIVTKTTVTVSGYPGREVVLRLTDPKQGDLIVKLRIVIAKNRLYQVMALSKGVAVVDQMTAFVESFVVTVS